MPQNDFGTEGKKDTNERNSQCHFTPHFRWYFSLEKSNKNPVENY